VPCFGIHIRSGRLPRPSSWKTIQSKGVAIRASAANPTSSIVGAILKTVFIFSCPYSILSIQSLQPAGTSPHFAALSQREHYKAISVNAKGASEWHRSLVLRHRTAGSWTTNHPGTREPASLCILGRRKHAEAYLMTLLCWRSSRPALAPIDTKGSPFRGDLIQAFSHQCDPSKHRIVASTPLTKSNRLAAGRLGKSFWSAPSHHGRRRSSKEARAEDPRQAHLRFSATCRFPRLRNSLDWPLTTARSPASKRSVSEENP